jgi:hypothetical protein
MALQCFSKEFTDTLDKWLSDNDQKYADQLAKAINIPDHFKFTGKLYRGMLVTPEFIELAAEGRMVFDKYTSWSKSKTLAIKFTKDTKYVTAKKKDLVPVLITKNISKAQSVLDIYNYALFTGGVGLDPLSVDSSLKEEEVLVKKNIKIAQKEVELL